MISASTTPRRVVARCPRCRISYGAGELQILDVEPGGRLVRRCGGCGLVGPSFGFRRVEVSR